MVASRRRPKGIRAIGRFSLSVLVMSLVPRQIGYQDLVALQARQPEAAQRARAALASPFGTIHAATFSLPRPVGTLIPEPPPYRLASLAPGSLEIAAALGQRQVDFPAVNRRLKGDLLVSPPRDNEPDEEPSRDLTPARVKTVSFPRPADAATANLASIAPQAPVESATFDLEAEIVTAALSPANAAPEGAPLLDPVDHTNPAVRLGRLYFGNNPVGEAVGPIQPWPMGEELLIETPANDADIKRSAIAARPNGDGPAAVNETVAPKGEVTGPGKRPKTPAERLGLDPKARAKAEKCLAEAVYFESRSEAKRGQIAVAQVVMNRVFSGFYPTNVCGVVYQNAHRKLACQFTFACDNVRDVVNEPAMWRQATEIARDMLDGRLWLPEVGHSTHYHAYWVHPAWVREMRRMQKIGVHSFYRPRAWGDGAEAPPLGQPEGREAETKANL
jgi:spore germination cell wall hydrolase CwlJ-like protein